MLTFVHTADWQIGKPFGRFAPDVAARLRAARLEVIDRIAAVARAHRASHVLVAGDVYDSEHLDDASLRQPLGRMGLYPGIDWHLLPGNHDPHRRGGVWERVIRLGPPPNVNVSKAVAVEWLRPNVALLSAPLRAREASKDPTLWMMEAETPPGTIRIGMAHGSVQGFGSLGEAAVPIDIRRRADAGLSYLALGDWHGTKEIAEGVWYSGTPEPDSYSDNDPGHVLVVRIESADAPVHVERIATAGFLWRERRLRMSRLRDLEVIDAELREFGPDRGRLLLSLLLEGAIGAAAAAGVDKWLERLAGELVALDVDRRRLDILIAESDVTTLADPGLAAVGGRLRAMAEGSDPAMARIAVRAARRLLSLAADVPGETGSGDGRRP